MIIFNTDLENTIIFSYKHDIGENKICAEIYRDREVSFITPKTAELLNYSRAAEDLLIARQSLRQSVGALEEEIGKPLFVNTKNHLSLTEYGEYLYVAG